MSAPQVEGQPKKSHWKRAFRPLFAWVLLVLVLYSLKTHERWMEKTRLVFRVTFDGTRLDPMPAATIDGLPIGNGDLISLGRHQFAVSSPKWSGFTTNLFIWYGGKDLGNIHLSRLKGTLTLSVVPPANLLAIDGPEFWITLTNSSGFTNSIPTDKYSVRAYFHRSQERQEVTVANGSITGLQIAPQFGDLEITSNEQDATYELTRSGESVEQGTIPAKLTELMSGPYKLTAFHHGHRRDVAKEIRSGTNQIDVRFEYGTARIESIPSGASVLLPNGSSLGVTPITLSKLEPGVQLFQIRRDGFLPVNAILDVQANQTATSRTTLTNATYAELVGEAKRKIEATDYDRAIQLLNEALRITSDEQVGMSLLHEATGLRSVRIAEGLGAKGDYISGIAELNKALEALPQNGKAARLLADFKRHEPEQVEQIRVERLNRPKRLFDAVCKGRSDSDLFEAHELKSKKSAAAVETAIYKALREDPAFRITKRDSPERETFEILAEQELMTFLQTSAGKRQCIIVGGQTTDDETQIRFKVLEFKAEAVNKFSIGALIKTPVAVTYSPIHPSRGTPLPEKLQQQLSEGISNVTARIKLAAEAVEVGN